MFTDRPVTEASRPFCCLRISSIPTLVPVRSHPYFPFDGAILAHTATRTYQQTHSDIRCRLTISDSSFIGATTQQWTMDVTRSVSHSSFPVGVVKPGIFRQGSLDTLTPRGLTSTIQLSVDVLLGSFRAATQPRRWVTADKPFPVKAC